MGGRRTRLHPTREPVLALSASIIGGISWIAVLACLNISAQVALPDWVRGRGLAIYVTVFSVGLTVGSAIWGRVAASLGLPSAHLLAAAGALLTIPVTKRWKLQTGAELDLTPSMHWPTPVITQRVEADQGPVLVSVEYRVRPQHRVAFLNAMERVGRERRRDGAYAWGMFEDTARPNRFLETFLLESWLEHLRQHHRVTNADRMVEDRVGRFLEGTRNVTHLIAAEAGKDPPKEVPS